MVTDRRWFKPRKRRKAKIKPRDRQWLRFAKELFALQDMRA